MTMSPDVGTSTNISSVLNERIYGPDREDAELGKQLEVKYNTSSWWRPRTPGRATSASRSPRPTR